MTDELRERIKELECLYRISSLLTRKNITLKELLPEVLDIMIPAWQFPEITGARIVVRSTDMKSRNYENTRWKLKERIDVDGVDAGFVEVAYRTVPGSDTNGRPPLFLDEERKLLRSIADLVGTIVSRNDSETEVKKTLNELKRRTQEVERTNIALREVLTHFDREKGEILSQISAGIRQNVFPILHALRHFSLSDAQREEYLELLARNLDHSLGRKPGAADSGAEPLTPRELEVVNMIREGFQNKEIARQLTISIPTVERHRFNIRKKLGLSGKRVNLSSYLRSE